MKWEWIYASWPLKLQATFPTSIMSVLIYAWLQINLLSLYSVCDYLSQYTKAQCVNYNDV